MGITHYWEIRKTIDSYRFAKIASDVKKAIPYLGVELADGDGTGEPEITESLIRFNGKTPNDYETFDFSRFAREPYYSNIDGGLWFAFCKTGFSKTRPYDIAVKVALIIAKHHLGNDIIVTSDEGWREWVDALEIVGNIFGYMDFSFGPSLEQERGIIR